MEAFSTLLAQTGQLHDFNASALPVVAHHLRHEHPAIAFGVLVGLALAAVCVSAWRRRRVRHVGAHRRR